METIGTCDKTSPRFEANGGHQKVTGCTHM